MHVHESIPELLLICLRQNERCSAQEFQVVSGRSGHCIYPYAYQLGHLSSPSSWNSPDARRDGGTGTIRATTYAAIVDRFMSCTRDGPLLCAAGVYAALRNDWWPPRGVRLATVRPP